MVATEEARRAGAPALPEPLAHRRALRESLEALAADVDRRRREEGFGRLLRVMARQWRYSLFNQWLIAVQRPEATFVAGRRAWERQGRVVRPGARGIVIGAPSRRAAGGVRTYWVRVYDLADTDGPALATLHAMPAGDTGHVAALERAAARLGVEVGREPLGHGCAGQSLGGRILVRPGLTPVAECRVLAHELAHELLHQAERERMARLRRPGPRRTHEEKETEADATAHVVLQALGLPSCAVDYIAWQGGDGAAVLRSWKRVAGAARRILGAVGERPEVGPHPARALGSGKRRDGVEAR